uniref:Uncharacterized protein n=1 Tax=Lactuca sativa TaxID=4236 RepID=A0A9R1W0Y4_LACSA|nr:hypothetical protein LSAT_V11C400199070 [Lactuca sativa]
MVAFTVFHREECDKVPFGGLFYIWYLTKIEVFHCIAFALALYLSCMALDSMPSSKICEDHWVTHLALSYEVDSSEVVPIPIREMGPASPPSAQSGVSSYDGAGTLGMYPGDTDDDSEESSEDEEGEYESSD